MTALIRLFLLVVFILPVLVLGLLFGMYNSGSLSFQFWHYQTPELPITAWIVGVFILGLFVGVLFTRLSQAAALVKRKPK